jgi:hypothetical protein
VLSGYFDTRITGKGKIRADSTRFQNYGVRRGKLDEVLTPKAKDKDVPKAGAAAGTHAGTPDAATAAALKREAARDLLAHFYGRTTFSPLAKVPNAQPGAAPIAGEDIRQIAQASKGFGSIAPSLHALFQPGAQERLERQLQEEPEKVYSLLHSALRENTSGSYIDVDPTVRRNFENEGRYERPKAIDGQAAIERLSDPAGTEYDIPGSVYNQDIKHSPTEIETAYENDHVIGAVRDELPAFTDGHAFDAAVKDLRADLRRQGGELLRWKQKRAAGVNAGPQPVAEHVLQRKAEGLLRASQLRRRHQEAVDRTSALAAPSAISPSQIVEEHFHFPDSDSAAEFQARRQLSPGDGRTIDG